MARPDRIPRPFRGLAAGIAGGLIASFAMNQFQKAWSAVLPPPSGDPPATVKAANKASRAATGEPVDDANEKAAGNAVHYLFGGAVGAAYGLLAEYLPSVRAGFGTAFGLASATLFDEVAVPAAGLAEGPDETPAATHTYGYASHLVFGGVTEGVRRLVRTG